MEKSKQVGSTLVGGSVDMEEVLDGVMLFLVLSPVLNVQPGTMTFC